MKFIVRHSVYITSSSLHHSWEERETQKNTHKWWTHWPQPVRARAGFNPKSIWLKASYCTSLRKTALLILMFAVHCPTSYAEFKMPRPHLLGPTLLLQYHISWSPILFFLSTEVLGSYVWAPMLGLISHIVTFAQAPSKASKEVAKKQLQSLTIHQGVG
jgi:hypothetical protein